MAGTVTTGTTVLVDRYPYNSTPKTVPVSLDMVRAHLELSHTADDELVYGVGGYVEAATAIIENRANTALISQKRQMVLGAEYLDKLYEGTFSIPFRPVTAITSITYLDVDEVERTLATSYYRLAKGNQLYFKEEPPSLADGPGTMWVDFTCGFGDSPNDVPSQWRYIVLLQACRMYEFRSTEDRQSKEWAKCLENLIYAAGGDLRGY